MVRFRLIAGVVLPLVLAGGQARADDAEVQALRAQLRSTVLQLRELQDRQAAPPAAASPAPDADAAKKLAAAQREAAAAKRRASGLEAALAKAQAESSGQTASASANAAELEKSKAAYAQAAQAARDTGAERDRLKAQLDQTTKVAAACRAENARLVALSESILDDYRKAGVLKALQKREPFVGFRRVQLENIAQDREDVVRANRCDPQPHAGS